MNQQIKKKVIPKYKIVFLGDTCVGKTTLISKYVLKTVTTEHQPTIGIDFFAHNADIGGREVKLQIWDTAGQERFRSLVPNYTRNSFMAIVLFDLTRRESFDNIDGWIEDFVLKTNKEGIKIIIVGNKKDLLKEVKEEKHISGSPAEETGNEPLHVTSEEKVLEENIDETDREIPSKQEQEGTRPEPPDIPTEDEIMEKVKKYNAEYVRTCCVTKDGIEELVKKIEEAIITSRDQRGDREDVLNLEAKESKKCSCM